MLYLEAEHFKWVPGIIKIPLISSQLQDTLALLEYGSCPPEDMLLLLLHAAHVTFRVCACAHAGAKGVVICWKEKMEVMLPLFSIVLILYFVYMSVHIVVIIYG